MPSVTLFLGYLPQHLSELTGTALGVWFVGLGLFFLITGRAPEPSYERFRGWRMRSFGAAAIALGIAAAALSFLTNAEPADYEGSHWGDTTDRVVAGIWLLFLGGIVAFVIRRLMRYERHGSTSERLRQVDRAD